MLNVARAGPIHHGRWRSPSVPATPIQSATPATPSAAPHRRQVHSLGAARISLVAAGSAGHHGISLSSTDGRVSQGWPGLTHASPSPTTTRRAVSARAAPPQPGASGAGDFEDEPFLDEDDEGGDVAEGDEGEFDYEDAEAEVGSAVQGYSPSASASQRPPAAAPPAEAWEAGGGEFDEDEYQEGNEEEVDEDAEGAELYEAFMRSQPTVPQMSPERVADTLQELEGISAAQARGGVTSTSGRGAAEERFTGQGQDFQDLDDADAYALGGEEGDEDGEAAEYGEAGREDLDEDGEEEEEDGDGGRKRAGGAQFPKPPKRVYVLHELFFKSAILDLAERMQRDFPNVVASGLQTDSGKVRPGDVFFYMPTPEDEVAEEERFHLPLEVQAAVASGAIAVVVPEAMMPLPRSLKLPPGVPLMAVMDVEHIAQQMAVAFYDAPARDLAIVAVAGSYGKTTVSWLVRGILEQLEQMSGMIGSIEYALAEVRLDEDGNVWEAADEDPTEGRTCTAPFMLSEYAGRYNIPLTTPQGLHIQKLLAGMRDRGAGCAVVECTTSALARNYCQWLDVGVVVWTNLSAAGGSALLLEELESRDAVFQAQMELMDKLDDPLNQAAVINADDAAASLVRARIGNVPCVSFGIDNQSADVLLKRVSYSTWETDMVIVTPLGKIQIITSLLGRHNVYNVLAAVATGIALRVPLKAIVAGIEAVESIPGRSEVIDVLANQEFPVCVDAACTPESLTAMLDGLRAAGAKRIFTVLGCPGEQEKLQRAAMGSVADKLSDYVIMTNDSPRREDPPDIIADMVAGLPDSVIHKYSSFVYNPFQDQGHVPLWFEPYLQKAQQTCKRYIMEDRFSAIRAAIGTAGPGDAVLIAGRGHLDFVEHGSDEGDEVLRGWFDDRREAAHALSKLRLLYGVRKLERKTLPWGNTLDEMDTVKVIDLLNKSAQR